MQERVNPIVVEIIRNAINSAAREMNSCLIRSAFGPGIFEMKDCSVGIFDRDARLLGQSSGLPIFLGNLEICIQIVTEKIGLGGYQPGDVFIMNDPYLQGTHAADITVFAPIFYQGKLEGFSAVRAAMHDMGGKNPIGNADSTEVYQEGMRIPPVRLCVAGKMNEDVVDLLCINSRYHTIMRGDLNACIAACYTGETRMGELFEKYGTKGVGEASKEIFMQSEKMDREAVREIPDGEYLAEGSLDNDGITDGERGVKVKVIIKGDEMTIDLSGSAKMGTGPINCGEAQTIAACRVGYKEMINPDSQVSGGTFQNLKVIVEKGTFLAAEEPAPCGWYFTGLGLLIDLIVKALSPVLPEKAAAAHYGDSNVILFSGFDNSRQSQFGICEATAGGWGAFAGGDGQNGLINVVNGDLKNWGIEFIESKYPLRILSYQIRPDSEGAGKYRGGMGLERTYMVENEDGCNLMLWVERSKTTAWGLFGGQAGLGPDVVINPGSEKEKHYLKTNMLPLKKGDIVKIRTGGGGGYGLPTERDRKDLETDIENGYISKKRAQEIYKYV
ncbi:hydantoinase B/oxoprolinase family protein [Lachnoclostridium phocaeense]|uniref:hydantoinase B/oxoprolinase family protein n=1 Tax=Lachnoclostridium phocaeense TaxID=1871021 RepID=UPI00248F0CF3|nr:hydantoinase B/oxoprolinase family protein [Lachnoclostridium phocaeense]